MIRTNLIVRSNKIKANRMAPVYLSLSRNGRTVYLTTKIRVHTQYWDRKRQQVTSRHPSANRVNHQLESIRFKTSETLLELSGAERNHSLPQIKQILLGDEHHKDFLSYADEQIQDLHKAKRSIRLSTANRYRAVINKLKTFVGNNILLFKRLDKSLIKKFENHLVSIGNSPGTVKSNLSALRALTNRAIKDGLISISNNPFHGYNMPRVSSERPFLTEEELSIIRSLDLTLHPRLELTRDMFVFATYAGGIRIADLLLLKKSNVQSLILQYTMRKTNRVQRVKLNEVAYSLFEKYLESPGEFIFPRMRPDYEELSEDHQHKAISCMTTICNKHLKEIQARAGIEKKLTTHIGRHTFGTLALTKGIRLEVVSKLMGHSDTRITQNYARLIDPILDEAIDQLI